MIHILHATAHTPAHQLTIDVARDETCDIVIFDEGCSVDITHMLTINLKGERACATVHGIVCAQANTRSDWRIMITHSASYTSSKIMMHALVADTARVSLATHGHIAEHASGSVLEHISKALIASPRARAQLIPKLEVITKQVVARHGSAVGRLNQEAKNYWMARGISEDDARTLLTRGFLNAVVEQITDTAAREMVTRCVLEKFA